MKILDLIAGKIHGKLFGMRCDIAPGIRYFDESHFKGLVKEDFEFSNSENYKIRGGIYHYEKYKEDTIIVFCHGIGGGHQAYMKEIEYLCRNGFKVLACDYQGTIASEGDKVGGFTRPVLDMAKCIEILKPSYKNIYVIGHSWGGWVASALTYIDKDIKKAVYLAGLNSLDSLASQYFKGPTKILKKSFYKIEENNFGNYCHLKMEETINREDLNALVFQSKDDSILHFENNFEEVKKHCTNKNVQFIELDKKNHNPTYTVRSVVKLNNYLEKLNKLKDPVKKNAEALKVDFDELCELDEEVMKKIVDFFDSRQ